MNHPLLIGIRTYVMGTRCGRGSCRQRVLLAAVLLFLSLNLTTPMTARRLHPSRMQFELSTSPSSAVTCPLDFSVIDWSKYSRPRPLSLLSTCGGSCCADIYTVLGLVLTPYVRSTSNLVLPDYITAQACLQTLHNEFQKKQLLPANAIYQCGLRADDLSATAEFCNGVHTVDNLRSRTNVKAMDSNCNGSSPTVTVDCASNCRSAMAAAHRNLSGVGQANHGCKFLVVNYVLSVLNNWGSSNQVNSSVCIATAMAEFVGGGVAVKLNSQQVLSPNDSNSSSTIEHFPSLYKAGFAAGAAAIVVSTLLAISMHMSRRLKRFTKERDLMAQQSSVVQQSVSGNTAIEWFSYDVIKLATGNFCPSNLIGKGGFGSVYKGTLTDGTHIAVKKFQNASDMFGSSFVPELEVISQVRHQNLVMLRGCSIAYGIADGHQLLLVYDYMANGSLKDYLFDKNKPPLLWPERRKIAIGIATGLAYLHNGSKLAIIHRDVKAANILLDHNLEALVADFGLAKFKPEDITHFTTRVAGTLGYVAPEYAMFGQLTNKSDVYSFGILLLELMSGRRALNMFLSSESLERSLISHWAYDLLQEGKLGEVLDEKIGFQYADKEEQEMMANFIKVGLLCAHSRSTSRPTMVQALRMLKGEVQVDDIPIFPDAATVLQPTSPDHHKHSISALQKVSTCHSSAVPDNKP